MLRKVMLILKENHFARDMESISNAIITNNTFLRNTVTHENTPYRLNRKLMTFMWRQINEIDTTKSMQHVIDRGYAPYKQK